MWRTLDEGDVAQLLAPFEYEGVSVLDHVDTKPVAMTGRYLVFAYHHAPPKEWAAWKAKR